MQTYGTPCEVDVNWTHQGLNFFWTRDSIRDSDLCVVALLPIRLKMVHPPEDNGCGFTVAIEKTFTSIPVVFKNYNMMSQWYSIDNCSLSGYTGEAGDDPAERKKKQRETAQLGHSFFLCTGCDLQRQFVSEVFGEKCDYSNCEMMFGASKHFPISFYDTFYFHGGRTLLRTTAKCEQRITDGSACGLPVCGQGSIAGVRICAWCDSVQKLNIQ